MWKNTLPTMMMMMMVMMMMPSIIMRWVPKDIPVRIKAPPKPPSLL